MDKLFLLLFAICFISCKQTSETEKNQRKRDNIFYVHDKVREIDIEDIYISHTSCPFVVNEYIFIRDYNTHDEYMRVFNKNNFNYILSIGSKRQGPGEITNMGHIGVNENARIFYVSDHGKQKVFSYSLDSVLVNPFYIPDIKTNLEERFFPYSYTYINDTLSIGWVVQAIGNSDYKPTIGKWNMTTGEIELMKYENPKVEKKRISCAVSNEHQLYVECYLNYNLMTICDFNGNLKYNIYGSNWKTNGQNIGHYGDVVFCNDKIIAAYSGEKRFNHDRNNVPSVNEPTKLLVFDINGDYIKTLETGYPIVSFCYDGDNHRIIMTLNDEIQFVYLDLGGVV